MTPDDRPYVLFRKVRNKGLTPRKETKAKDGSVSRPAHPGEFTEDWSKALVSHRAPFEPYCWVSKDWILTRIHAGCIPIGFGNLDKLPADYPKEWRARLEEAVGAIAGTVRANQEVVKLRAENEALLAKLAGDKSDAKQDAAPGESDEGSGRDAAPIQKPSRAARQAAHV